MKFPAICRHLRLAMPACAAAAAILGLADAAAAQGRRHARVSSDLAERLRAGDQREASVILTGTGAQIDALAARHGLRIAKRLATGAVVDVPAGGLPALADDPAADHISSNHVVSAQMTLTNQSIGADLVHEGGWAPGIGPLTGKGIGVAVIDSGVAPLPELRGRIVASRDFTDDGGAGRDLNGHGTHVAGIIAAAGRNRFDDTQGVAPGADIISLKVLDAKGRGVAGALRPTEPNRILVERRGSMYDPLVVRTLMAASKRSRRLPTPPVSWREALRYLIPRRLFTIHRHRHHAPLAPRQRLFDGEIRKPVMAADSLEVAFERALNHVIQVTSSRVCAICEYRCDGDSFQCVHSER